MVMSRTSTRAAIGGGIAAVVIAISALTISHHHHRPPAPKPVPTTTTTTTSTTTTIAATTTIASSGGSCHMKGVLPDPVCTPGVTNPNVTQANIKSTICVTGWTATIRPPQSYTTNLKIIGIKAYGFTDTNTAHYEEDHLISLELGGNPTDPKNLWPEPGPVPNPKDQIEGKLRGEVCAGTMTLADAQYIIATDWTKG